METYLVADSGSTKTDWCFLRKGKKPLYFKTHGINPYIQNKESITAMLQEQLPWDVKKNKVERISYYGAGMAVKVGGMGDITKDRLWLHPKNIQRVGSGTIVGEHVYIVEENGMLAEGLRLDGVHMTTEGGTNVLDFVLDHAVQNGAAYFNKELYAFAYGRAEPVTMHGASSFADTQDEFKRQAVISRKIDIAPIAVALAGRPFEEDISNRLLKLSWCGNARKPFNANMRFQMCL